MDTVQSDLHKWETNLKPLASVVDDTISRQAAIDAVADLYWMDERLLNFKKEIDATFDKIKALPSAQPEQRWIPCSERLPLEQEADYWICTNTGYQCQSRWTNRAFGIVLSENRWRWKICDSPQHTDVIAWQPLPEPYKADMRGEENA